MSTYTPVASQTLSANSTSVAFNNLPQNYTDLVIVISYASTSNDNSLYMKLGSGSIDTGSNYSTTVLSGNGTSAVSGRIASTANGIWLNGWAYGCSSSITTPSTAIVNLQNYSNSNTYKTILSRAVNKRDDGNGGTDLSVGLWRSTSAINTVSITFISGSLLSGTTVSIYGIQAGTPKAQGGQIVTTDGTYWYHAFTDSGTFTPSSAISADVLVVAGGGGGASYFGAGAGAGGITYKSSASLASATAYSVVVGSGGSYTTTSANAFNGTNSSFDIITAVGGGGAWLRQNPNKNGNDGGSGAGGAGQFTGTPLGGAAVNGTNGTTYYGNAGGNGYTTGLGNGGGGGAGGAGTAGSSGSAQNTNQAGGPGISTYSSWGVATNTGHNVSGTVYFGGGGMAGSYSTSAGSYSNGGGGYPGGTTNATAGIANTGGGGGGGSDSKLGSNGGSGIVIIRYAV